MSRGLLLGVSIACAVGLGSAWVFWWSPRNEAIASIENLQAGIRSLKETTDQAPEVADRLREAGNAMLGREPDSVRHRLRTLLGEIASPLDDVVVDDRAPRARTNPAVEARAHEFRDERGSVDALMIEASLAATGGLEEVLRVLATIEAQPWAHIVESAQLRVLGKNRDRVELRVDLISYFAPDLGPEEVPVVVEPTEDALAAVARFSDRNIFRRPPAPVVVKAPPERATTPAPAPRVDPRTRWRIVGLTRGREGLRAVVKNDDSGVSKTLAPGEVLAGLVFETHSGGLATFSEVSPELARSVQITLNQTLSQGAPVGG